MSMSLKKLGKQQGRRTFLKASVIAAAAMTLTDRSPALAFAPYARARTDGMRVWSDQPAFTRLFANEQESSISSDIYDGVWAGDPEPSLPRVAHPSPTIKRWHSGEGEDYLDEETNAATRGKYPNPIRIWEAEQYPIGNGRLAASVFPGSGRDRYSLNEVSFWSGERNPGTVNSKGDKHFDGENGPEIGEDGFGGYEPIGDLLVACRREFVTADAAGRVGILPPNGSCICRIGVDISAKLSRQVGDGREDAACNDVTLNFGEPEFDLVEP
jgi:hypothetical protein